MPAPDLPSLYDFEDTLASAFKTYLVAESIGATIQVARDDDQQAAPLVLLRVEHTGALEGLENKQKIFGADGTKDIHFAGQLITTVRTSRRADAGTNLLGAGLNSVLFDGDGDYLTASNSNISTANVSVSVWFTATEVPAGLGSCAGLLDNRDRSSTGSGGGWTMELCDGNVYFAVYTSAWTSLGSAVSDGVRYHAVGTYDGSNLRLYLDGALISTTAVTGDIVYDASSVRFGSELGGGRDYDGALHDIRVYDDALSLTEVQTLYANGDVTSGETGHWAWDGDLTDVYGANATSYGDAALLAATDAHRAIRRALRASIYDCFKATDGIADELDYYRINSIVETDTAYATDDDEGFDDTEITWELRYVILDDAWPA